MVFSEMSITSERLMIGITTAPVNDTLGSAFMVLTINTWPCATCL